VGGRAARAKATPSPARARASRLLATLVCGSFPRALSAGRKRPRIARACNALDGRDSKRWIRAPSPRRGLSSSTNARGTTAPPRARAQDKVSGVSAKFRRPDLRGFGACATRLENGGLSGACIRTVDDSGRDVCESRGICQESRAGGTFVMALRRRGRRRDASASSTDVSKRRDADHR